MKKHLSHIGMVVVGLILMVQAASAQEPPKTPQTQLAQIDAEEISGGEEDSRIRFSDVEKGKKSDLPSQQTRASWFLVSNESSAIVRNSNQDNNNRNDDTWNNQQNRNQRNQNQQNQNQNQNQQNQNQNQQNQNQQNDQGRVCPGADRGQCPDEERRRCEDNDGIYQNGKCYTESDGWDVLPCDRTDTCPLDDDRHQQSFLNGGEDDMLVGLQTLVRTEKRKACEKKGGEYIGNDQCLIRNWEHWYCTKKGGSYNNDECIINTDEL